MRSWELLEIFILLACLVFTGFILNLLFIIFHVELSKSWQLYKSLDFVTLQLLSQNSGSNWEKVTNRIPQADTHFQTFIR